MTRHSWPGPPAAEAASSGFVPSANRQDLQTQITADAVLQVHHIIALFQFREVDVQRGARGLRVRRLEPARPLHFVTTEDLGIGDHDDSAAVGNKTARERAHVQNRFRQASGLWQIGGSPGPG